MKKLLSVLTAAILTASMLVLPAAAEAAEDTAADAGSVIEISTAEELMAVADDLTADYILTEDIDLAGLEWTPIGAFSPTLTEDGEMSEIPDPEYAFTGSFDGDGHTIRNLSINAPEDWVLGLFGCISEATVGNFTLENASVTGSTMVSDVVGYAHSSEVYDVTLTGGVVTARYGEMSEEGMYGGIVAAGMGSLIRGCSAEATVVIPDDTANAGIVGGGLEATSVIGCSAKGIVIAGQNCYGLGGISGCGFGAEEFTDCEAEDVIIIAGEGSYWVGGITGYAGGYADESVGIPVTVFTNCNTKAVTMVLPEEAEGVDAIVGSGFFNEEYAEMAGAPYDAPTEFELVDCTAEE